MPSFCEENPATCKEEPAYRVVMSADDEGMPTWVKVVGAITLLLIGAFVVVALTGAGPGDHGPGRHAMSDEDPIGGSSDSLAACGAQAFKRGSSPVVNLAWDVKATRTPSVQAFCST